MKVLAWPWKWMKVLPFVAVSGSMIFAMLTQWAGSWSWVELVSHFRLYVLLLCVVGTGMFLVGLSLGRVILGVAVSVWLAWPLAPYFFPPSPSALSAAPPSEDGTRPDAPPDFSMVVFNLHYQNQTPGIMDAVLAWDADLVVLCEVTPDFYRRHFQAARERYPEHWIGPAVEKHGLWCFTRLPLANDLSRTRTKAAGVDACDWTLRLGNAHTFRLIALHPPPPLDEAGKRIRRQALFAAAEAIGSTDGPRILAGDLNCSPFSPYFRDLLATARVRDSALGQGLLPTWSPFPLFGLTLDHVLISDHWNVVQRQLGDHLGSDHRPVRVTLRMNP